MLRSAVRLAATRTARRSPLARSARQQSTGPKGEWHEKKDASGRRYFKNMDTGAVSYEPPEFYLPLTAQDSAFVRFLKFDMVGERDLRGRKLAAALAAIGVIGLYIDYRRTDGIFGWYERRTNPEGAAAAAKASARRRGFTPDDDDDDETEYEYSIELEEVESSSSKKK